MKKNFFILWFMFFSIVISYSCHKDKKPKKLGTIDFTDQDRNIIPYYGGEILVFRDSLGDSIPVTVSNRYLGYMQIPINDDANSDYYDVEQDQITSQAFDIWLYQSCPPIDITSTKSFYIYLFYIGFSHSELKGLFRGNWGFDAGKLFQLQNGYSGVSFYDSLKIINKTFYSVYDLFYIGAAPPDSIETYNDVYFNTNYGFVGLKTNKGRRWYIDKL